MRTKHYLNWITYLVIYLSLSTVTIIGLHVAPNFNGSWMPLILNGFGAWFLLSLVGTLGFLVASWTGSKGLDHSIYDSTPYYPTKVSLRVILSFTSVLLVGMGILKAADYLFVGINYSTDVKEISFLAFHFTATMVQMFIFSYAPFAAVRWLIDRYNWSPGVREHSRTVSPGRK